MNVGERSIPAWNLVVYGAALLLVGALPVMHAIGAPTPGRHGPYEAPLALVQGLGMALGATCIGLGSWCAVRGVRKPRRLALPDADDPRVVWVLRAVLAIVTTGLVIAAVAASGIVRVALAEGLLPAAPRWIRGPVWPIGIAALGTAAVALSFLPLRRGRRYALLAGLGASGALAAAGAVAAASVFLDALSDLSRAT